MTNKKILNIRNAFEATRGVDLHSYQNSHSSSLRSSFTQLDFTSQKDNWALSRELAKRYFGIALDAPEDSLCPTIPSRFDYVCFIRELEILTILTNWKNYKHSDVYGIDIGTGYSCIYGLLCAKQFHYKMTCVDVNEEAVMFAIKNAKENSLEDYIDVILNPQKQNIFLPECFDKKSYLFCMSNPPFYQNESEYNNIRLDGKKQLPSKSKITGFVHEMVFEGYEDSFRGGEGFIAKAIEESLEGNYDIIWYTFLVFKKETLENLMDKLTRHSDRIKTIFWRASQPGNTRRWFLAWSFKEFPNPSKMKIIKCGSFLNKIKIGKHSVLTEKCIETQSAVNIDFLVNEVKGILEDSHIKITLFENYGHEVCLFVVLIESNTWNRAYKRRKTTSEILKSENVLEVSIAVENNLVTMHCPNENNSLLYNSFYQLLMTRLTNRETIR